MKVRGFVIENSKLTKRLTNQHGLTVLNLLVSMAIIAVVGAMGIMQFNQLDSSFNRLNAQSVFIQDLKQAQAEAITEGCRGILELDSSGESYTFGCDYLAYDTSSPPSADVQSFERILPDNISMGISEQIIFNSRGHAVDKDDILTNVNITFTDSSLGNSVQFATGTLVATGLFTYD